MPSSIIDSDYYGDMFGTDEMRSIFSDQVRLQKWLQTEVALAKAQSEHNIIPKKAALKIADAASLSNIDVKEMKEEFDKVGFPILPFVHQLTKACDSDTARWVHYGATTQDILDTGTVLQMKEAFPIIENDLEVIIKALVNVSKKHRDTVMAGRTFQQQAAPITLGYKTAIWLDELLRHKERLEQLKPRLLVGQCSGAVGTFATLGDKGMDVQESMMNELGLHIPDITWHVARDRWGELLSWFSLVAATLGKIANEIAILMRTEIAELSEPYEDGRGASSTLPQKRNPIECEPIIAIAHKIRELTNSQHTAMIQEHERGVGQMHLEWMVIPDAFVLISGSLFHAKNILSGLYVDKEQMRKNLEMGGGLLMSEAVMMGLAPKIGKKKAHDLVYEIAGNAYEKSITLKEALNQDEKVGSLLTSSEIDDLLDPINYTGVASKMIDMVLAKV